MTEKLALKGGRPVRQEPLPPPYPGALIMDKKEKQALSEIIEHKSPFRYYGPDLLKKVSEFEKSLVKYFKIKYALGVSSGTAALKVALVALGVAPGDEVIVPAYTFVSCVNAVVSARAVPVFVEIDDSLNIDPKDLKKKISARTKIIMAVHLQGVSCNMDAIMKVAKQNNVAVLEDCAQSFGASYKGHKLGTIGKMGIFSLQMNKLITTGEGGCVITNNRNLFLRSVRYHDHGNLREFSGGTPFLGENYRMSELAGALGVVQMKKINDILIGLKKAKQKILEKIKGIKGLQFRNIPDGAEDIGTSVIFFTPTDKIAKKFVAALNAENISSSRFYDGAVYKVYPQVRNMSTVTQEGCPFTCPLYKGKVNYYQGMCPKTEEITERLVYIPLAPTFSKKDIDDVAIGIRKVAAYLL